MCKSYSDDFQYASRLVRSFKRFNSDGLHLFFVVPQSDISMFSCFVGETISLLNEGGLGFDLVDDFSIRGIRPGYINQEIVKLSFWETGYASNYFCIDSDAEFIRSFYFYDFMFDESTPYTVLVQDHDLAIDPEYYNEHWKYRSQLLEEIKNILELKDRRTLTCHGNTTLNSAVLRSFKTDFLQRRGWSYKDCLEIAPYEFSWYNFWLQKKNTIPIIQIEPLFKYYHNKSQHMDSLRRGINRFDLARAYVGIVINSNFSRSYGVVDYEDGQNYIMLDLRRILRGVKRRIRNFLA